MNAQDHSLCRMLGSKENEYEEYLQISYYFMHDPR